FLIMALAVGVMSLAGFLATGSGARVSMGWVILAFFLLTVSEVLVSTVGLELAFTAAPNTMKSFVTACFLLTGFFGNLVTIPVSQYYGDMGPGPFFAVMAATMIALAVGIIPVGRAFNRSRQAALSEEQARLAAARAPATALGDGAAEERIADKDGK